MIIKQFFDLKMPEINLPDEKNREMLGDALRITSKSCRDSRLAMLKLCIFFKREFHFDSFQYAPFWALEDDEECYAYVWTVEQYHIKIKSVVVGGFCFRKREWGGYGMQWIWIHPYIRNIGLLSRHWKEMENKFGKDFYAEPPLSHGMENFLNKENNILHICDPELRKPDLWHTTDKRIVVKLDDPKKYYDKT